MGFPIDADPRYGAFTLRTDCPRCGAHLPANGPVAEVECGECAARVPVPSELLRDMVDAFEERWPLARAGETVTLGDLTWRWTWEATPGPHCVSCEAQVPAGDGDLLACAACGAETPAAKVPDPMRDAAPSAKRVYGGDPEGLEHDVVAEAVAMSCPQCGASLEITSAAQRITRCGHCEASVQLPDSVWRQLHPARTVRAWVVRFDGESRAARTRRIEAEREARARAKADADRERQRAKEEGKARTRAAEQAKREAAAAEAAAAKAERERRSAEAERWWNLLTLPLVLVAWAVALCDVVGLLGTAAWYAVAPPWASLVFLAFPVIQLTPRIAVFDAVFVSFFAWLVVFAAQALRSRQGFWALLPIALMQVAIAVIPVVGPFFAAGWAFSYLNGSEPTLANRKEPVPWSVRIPAAMLVVAFSLYTHVFVAAVSNISLVVLWQRFAAG